MAAADEQRVFAAYRELRNNYIPQGTVGSGWVSHGDFRSALKELRRPC